MLRKTCIPEDSDGVFISLSITYGVLLSGVETRIILYGETNSEINYC